MDNINNEAVIRVYRWVMGNNESNWSGLTCNISISTKTVF